MQMKFNKKNEIDYSVLSRRREDLFGLSILSIVYFHFCEVAGGRFTTPYLVLVRSIGVPIFLMLSGLGLYYSWRRNPSWKDFYKKRLARVVIPYLIVATVHFVLRYAVIEHQGMLAILKGICFADFVLYGDSQFWFVALILFMYVVFPLIYKIFETEEKCLIKLVIVLALVVGINLFIRFCFPGFYGKVEIMLTRIPAFIIGVYLGQKSFFKRKVQPLFLLTAAFLAIIFIVYAIIKYYFDFQMVARVVYRYSETAYAFLIMLGTAVLLERLNAAKLSKVLAFFGSMSLELYLVHISLRKLMQLLDLPVYNIMYYAVMAAIAVGVSFALSKFDGFATKKLTAK